MLLGARMDVFLSLRSILSETKSRSLQRVVKYVLVKVENGNPLWKAFETINIFPKYVTSLIRIGEETGNLSRNMRIIASQQIKDREFRSLLWSAMLYPIIVLTLGFILSIGLAWFVLPRLVEVYSSLETDLPTITRTILWVGQVFKDYGVYIVPVIISVVALTIFVLFIFRPTKFIGQYILLRMPGVGKLLTHVELARFGFLLGTLLDAGVPIVQALQSLGKATQVHMFQQFYIKLGKDASDGFSFEHTFKSQKNVNLLFPLAVQNLIISGNASGSLAEALLQVGRVYESKTTISSRNLAVILEPVMLILVWLVVLAIALSVIIPIYSLIGIYGR